MPNKRRRQEPAFGSRPRINEHWLLSIANNLDKIRRVRFVFPQ